jgi:NitT/TauT family transport system substrate-binding protein
MGVVALGSLLISTVSAADKVSIRVDWFHSSYHSPFFVGIEQGFYQKEGIELTVTEARGSGQVTQLVGNGDDEFGFAAADSVIRAVLKGIPLINVASIMPKGSQAVFVLKSSGITELADLAGKKMATTPGGSNDALLPIMLADIGMKESDLVMVAVSGATKVRMFLQGDVDAMMSPAWSDGYFTSAGGSNKFLYKDHGVTVVGHGIVTNSELAEENPELVRRFIRATLKSWEFAKNNPQESLDALSRGSPNNAKPNVKARNIINFAVALEFVGPAVAGKPFGLQNLGNWEKMQRHLLDSGNISETKPVAAYFTNKYVSAVIN